MTKESFNSLVEQAMANGDLTNMRPVVMKELLHYEIFQALDRAGLLKNLVFQGGTSLRLCRGSDRFSEDLDFVGGRNFDLNSMRDIAECCKSQIGNKFGLKVWVAEPKPRDPAAVVNVDLWQVSIETSPENRSVPRQRVKLEIANIPAYTSELVPLRANYTSIAAGSTVLVNTESIHEVLADKVVALPVVYGTGRVRYRDIWDIAWLLTQGAQLDPLMVEKKLIDYGVQNYAEKLDAMKAALPALVTGDFSQEMQRFIAAPAHANRFSNPGYAGYFVSSVTSQLVKIKNHLEALGAA